MKKSLLFCLLTAFGLTVVTPLYAQDRWSVKAELGGSALLYQLGVSRRILPNWWLSAGVGSIRLLENGTEKALQITSIPVQLLYDLPLKMGKAV